MNKIWTSTKFDTTRAQPPSFDPNKRLYQDQKGITWCLVGITVIQNLSLRHWCWQHQQIPWGKV